MPSQKPPQSDAEVGDAGSMPAQLPTCTVNLDGCVLGHWHNVLIGVWAIPSTLELVAEQAKLIKQLCARVPKVSSVHLVIKRAPLPAHEVRVAYQELIRNYGDRIVCSAIMLEGDGFWASAVRAFMTGVELFGRRLRSKTFAQVEPLAAWLASMHTEETGELIDPQELSRAIQWMLEQPLVHKHRGT